MSLSLLQRVAQGEADAVAACQDAYSGLVWSIARQMLRSQAEAEDAVQDVFIALWRSAARFDPKKGSEESFIATIARRRVIDRVRRRSREPEVELLPDTLVADGVDDAERLDRADQAAKALQALQMLSPPQQRTIELAVLQGRSHTQVAEETGLPLGTVKSHVRRGLLRMRQLLDADDGGTDGKA